MSDDLNPKLEFCNLTHGAASLRIERVDFARYVDGGIHLDDLCVMCLMPCHLILGSDACMANVCAHVNPFRIMTKESHFSRCDGGVTFWSHDKPGVLFFLTRTHFEELLETMDAEQPYVFSDFGPRDKSHNTLLGMMKEWVADDADL